MAHPMIRAQQKALATNRLVESTRAAAERFGAEPPAVPTWHQDADYLPTLQMEAVADFLDGLAPKEAPTDGEGRREGTGGERDVRRGQRSDRGT